MRLPHITNVYLHVGDAIHLLDRPADIAHHLRLVARTEQKGQPDLAGGGRGDVPDHFGRQDIGSGANAPDRGEGGRDSFRESCCGHLCEW
jgi:hypothetical protein